MLLTIIVICSLSQIAKCQQLAISQPSESYSEERERKAEMASNRDGRRGDIENHGKNPKANVEAIRNEQVENIIRDYNMKYSDLIINHRLETQVLSLGEDFALNIGKNLLLIGNVALIAQDINDKKYVHASSAVVCMTISYAPPPYGLTGGLICSLIRTSLLTIYENKEEKSIMLESNPTLP
jgi:hypothetical protein